MEIYNLKWQITCRLYELGIFKGFILKPKLHIPKGKVHIVGNKFLYTINTTMKNYFITLNHACSMSSLTFTVIYICSAPEENSLAMSDVIQ